MDKLLYIMLGVLGAGALLHAWACVLGRILGNSDHMNWLTCARHGHQLRFVRNVYGDEIRELGDTRSVWRCTHCKRVVFKNYLHTEAGQ